MQDQAALHIRMLGSLSFHDSQGLVRLDLGHRGSLLACYLLQFPDRLHRCARLVDLFWHDLPPDKARSAFNTAKWRIGRLLSAYGQGELLLRVADDMLVKSSPSVVVDTHTLDKAVGSMAALASAEALMSGDEERISKAVLAYSGPFLDGEDGEWILQERKRLQGSLVRAATYLMRANVARQNYDRALEFARRIEAVDPLNERSHLDLMLLLLLDGRQAEALQDYQRLTHMLRTELGINPMPEIAHLANAIRSGEIFPRLEEIVHRKFSTALAETQKKLAS